MSVRNEEELNVPIYRPLIYASLSVLLVSKLTFAEEIPVRLEIDLEEIPKNIWYGAYLDGEKAGYAKESYWSHVLKCESGTMKKGCQVCDVHKIE